MQWYPDPDMQESLRLLDPGFPWHYSKTLSQITASWFHDRGSDNLFFSVLSEFSGVF
jgi:hypothetical protein